MVGAQPGLPADNRFQQQIDNNDPLRHDPNRQAGHTGVPHPLHMLLRPEPSNKADKEQIKDNRPMDRPGLIPPVDLPLHPERPTCAGC